MDYAAVRAALFVAPPAGTSEPDVVRHASPARRLRDAFEPIAMHQVWSPSVAAALAEAADLAFFASYVWGRAAVLGNVEPLVAASAFAVFEPSVIAAQMRAGQQAISGDEILSVLDRSTITSLAGVIDPADAEEVVLVAGLLREAVDAADGTGRPLFCGVRALGWPDDAVGQLWRACHALREHRGDTHTAAFVAAGMDPVRMNILTELWIGYQLGGYSTSRAWGPDVTAAALTRLRLDGLIQGEGDATQLTVAGRARRDEIESATDRGQQDIVDRLGDRLDSVVDALQRWSALCISRGMFPPDLRKRAGG
ncbi:MAG: SCO6745 family protein [Acidimicrobiales bacterium]